MTLTLSVTPAQVDVAMGKAQAAMGRFEGSLVKQSDFIQDQMPATLTLTLTLSLTWKSETYSSTPRTFG